MFVENAVVQYELLEVIVPPIIIGILAYLSGSLDAGGSLIATFLGILILHASGPFYFVSLISFLALGSIFTKFKYDYKAELGIVDPGGRSVNPVLANGIIPAFLAVLGNPYYFISSTSAALADTLATEIGSLYKEPKMITSFEKVKPGTRGAISPLGQLAAVGGGLLMSFVGIGLLIPFPGVEFKSSKLIFIATIAGFFGCQIDSFLGASFDFLSKEEINLLGTLSGAAFSMMLVFLLG